MIKFFRKIRQKLLIENKLSKYLLYASGEIILVMIGILLALQVNNWNENRKERTQETLLLKQLLTDFNSNLAQLDQKISFRKDFMNSSKQLFKYIDNPNLRDKDSVETHIAKTLPYATFDPINYDLASSGELNIIQNTELKHALTRWSSEINDVIEDEIVWKKYRNEQYFPFLIKNYQLRTIRNNAYRANILGLYSLKIGENNDAYSKDYIGVSKHEEDLEALLDHPDLEDHLTRCYSINSWANVQSDILRNRLVEIITLIEQEIKVK